MFKFSNWLLTILKFRIIPFMLVFEFFVFILFCFVYIPFDFDSMYQNIGAGDYINNEVDIMNLSFKTLNSHIDTNIETNNYLCENGYLPIFYYNNYEITLNNKFYNYENKNGLIYVPNLKNKNVNVIVKYKNTFIQTFSYILSWINCLLFSLYMFIKRNKK